jgi:hypothetical protein
VDYLYSLYDALVSINVPNDKARAVVDAMERDMGTTIATKADLQMLRQATKSDLQLMHQGMQADVQLLRQEVKSEIAELRQDLKSDITELRQDNVLIRKELELLSSKMTVRLGSIQVVGLGLLFAALKLT